MSPPSLQPPDPPARSIRTLLAIGVLLTAGAVAGGWLAFGGLTGAALAAAVCATLCLFAGLRASGSRVRESASPERVGLPPVATPFVHVGGAYLQTSGAPTDGAGMGARASRPSRRTPL